MPTDRKYHFDIAKNLQRGDILFCKSYKFPDGTIKNKLIVVLSNCINDKFFVCVLPTSKIAFYKNPLNQTDIIWLEAKEAKCFSLTTVIDLKHYFFIRASDIGEKLYDKTLKKAGMLPKEFIQRINDVVINAKTLNVKIKNLILTS